MAVVSLLPARTVEFDEFAKMPRVRDLGFDLRVGDLVVLRSRGANRLARVSKVGTARVYTEYTTEAALRESRKYGGSLTVTRKPVRLDDDYLRFAGRPSSREL